MVDASTTTRQIVVPTFSENHCQQRSKKFSAQIPTLVIIAGFAGVGKTTLSEYLYTKVKWEVLNKDALKRQYLEHEAFLSQEQWDAVVEEAGQKACNQLLTLIEERLSQGTSIIVDSCGYTFVTKGIYEILDRLSGQVNVKYIFCHATEETREKRLIQRGSVFAPFVQDLPPIINNDYTHEYFQTSPYGKLEICTDGHLDEYKTKVLEYIQESPSVAERVVAPRLWQSFSCQIDQITRRRSSVRRGRRSKISLKNARILDICNKGGPPLPGKNLYISSQIVIMHHKLVRKVNRDISLIS